MVIDGLGLHPCLSGWPHHPNRLLAPTLVSTLVGWMDPPSLANNHFDHFYIRTPLFLLMMFGNP